MKRALYFMFILSMTTFFFCSCGARVNDDYFPLSIGSSWTYETEGTDAPRKWKVRIGKREKVSGQECILMESLWEGSDESLVREYYTKTAEGIFALKRCYPDGEVVFNPPELYMKAPLQVGQEWKWKGLVMNKKTEYSFQVEKRERIKVKENQYDCIKIVLNGRDETGEALKSNRWFASGIGMVKEETTLKNGTKEKKLTALLQSYELPGKSR